MRLTRSVPLLVLCAAFFVGGCSLLLDTGAEQCNQDGDCAARGSKFAGTRCVNKVCVSGVTDAGAEAQAEAAPPNPKWACLGNVKPPTFTKPKVVVSIPLVDLSTKKPVTMIDAKPCGKTDVACATPLGPTVQPSAQGILTFTLDAGFDGYVDLKSNVMTDGGLPPYIPALVFFNPPLDADLIYLTIPLLSPTSLGLLAAQFGNTIDPMMGAPFAATYDCTAKPSDGVSVDIDMKNASTRTFYFVNGLPTESATQTDMTGYSGFINVPPGIRNIRATLADGGASVGKVSVLVRPSTLTYTVLPPTP